MQKKRRHEICACLAKLPKELDGTGTAPFPLALLPSLWHSFPQASPGAPPAQTQCITGLSLPSN